MRVKFTNLLNVNEVLFGTVTEMYKPDMLLIQADNGRQYIINPNADFNFRFILNAEGEAKQTDAWNQVIDSLEM